MKNLLKAADEMIARQAAELAALREWADSAKSSHDGIFSTVAGYGRGAFAVVINGELHVKPIESAPMVGELMGQIDTVKLNRDAAVADLERERNARRDKEAQIAQLIKERDEARQSRSEVLRQLANEQNGRHAMRAELNEIKELRDRAVRDCNQALTNAAGLRNDLREAEALIDSLKLDQRVTECATLRAALNFSNENINNLQASVDSLQKEVHTKEALIRDIARDRDYWKTRAAEAVEAAIKRKMGIYSASLWIRGSDLMIDVTRPINDLGEPMKLAEVIKCC